MNKWMALLTSRKFWVNLIGILAAIGVLEFTDGEREQIVEAILIIVASLGYTITLAVEDGITRLAAAQRSVKIQEAIKEYTTRKA